MIFDLHSDLPTSGLDRLEDIAFEENTGNTVVYAFFTSQISSPKEFIDLGIERLFRSNARFAVEDLGFLQESDATEIDFSRFVYCGLTHNFDNALAGGALGSGDLTAFGKEVIRKMTSCRTVLDVAHLNRKSFYSVLDVADIVIDSHTGLDSLHRHLRNITDEQVRLILQKGGVIGLTAVRDFIGGDTVEIYAETIDRFVQKFGIDGAAIGTDFYGTDPLERLRSYGDFNAISEILLDKGYSDLEIHKIFFENANQFFRRII